MTIWHRNRLTSAALVGSLWLGLRTSPVGFETRAEILFGIALLLGHAHFAGSLLSDIPGVFRSIRGPASLKIAFLAIAVSTGFALFTGAAAFPLAEAFLLLVVFAHIVENDAVLASVYENGLSGVGLPDFGIRGAGMLAGVAASILAIAFVSRRDPEGRGFAALGLDRAQDELAAAALLLAVTIFLVGRYGGSRRTRAAPRPSPEILALIAWVGAFHEHLSFGEILACFTLYHFFSWLVTLRDLRGRASFPRLVLVHALALGLLALAATWGESRTLQLMVASQTFLFLSVLHVVLSSTRRLLQDA